MSTADTRPFDADNHYYEPLDAFTRHLNPAWRGRAVDIAEIGGRMRHVVGGQVNRAVTNPTFDPIVKPGCLYGYFRSNPDGKPREEYLRDSEPIPAHYRDRDARLAVMDDQGIAPCGCSRRSVSSTRMRCDMIPKRSPPRFGRSTAGWTKTGGSTTWTASSLPRTSRSST